MKSEQSLKTLTEFSFERAAIFFEKKMHSPQTRLKKILEPEHKKGKVKEPFYARVIQRWRLL